MIKTLRHHYYLSHIELSIYGGSPQRLNKNADNTVIKREEKEEEERKERKRRREKRKRERKKEREERKRRKEKKKGRKRERRKREREKEGSNMHQSHTLIIFRNLLLFTVPVGALCLHLSARTR